MKATRIAVSAVVAWLTLGGCAQPGAGPTQPEGAPVATASDRPGSTTPEQPAPHRPTGPVGSPPSATPSAPTRLTGTISAGVEPGCLLLDDYLLVGGPPDLLRAGVRVTVTGHVEPGLMTTCQQGTPFRVETATPA